MVHALNAFQILRLLATRGHYSIDIIIGWYVAVYVSNVAARLGRHYSKGTPLHEIMPATPVEAFETVTGVTDARNEAHISSLLKRKDVQDFLLNLQEQEEEEKPETTARIIHKQVHERLIAYQRELKAKSELKVKSF